MTPSRFPAVYVELPPETEGRKAPFFLAAEEYIARELPVDNYLFSWQLSPTVVMGRNQVAEAEINLDFCHKEGIDIVRRKSGGGAIFADEHNIMWSLVTGEGAVEPLFAEYAEAVAAALRKLGAPAKVSGRNDIILEGGGKICGNAFYHLTHRNIIHGTMLYDTNPRLMEGSLCPTEVKLQSKGVKSVRSRVSLLKDFLDFDATTLRGKLRPLLSDRSIQLDKKAVQEIDQIALSYYALDFLYGSTSTSDLTCPARHIEGCGTIGINFTLKDGLITDVLLTGDFFELGNAQAAFIRAFVGCRPKREAIHTAIAHHHPERTVRNLTTLALTDLLAQTILS